MRGDITGHHRSSSDIIRHHRVREGCRVPYGPSQGTATGMGRRVRYRPSPDRVPSGPSRAVGLVAGSRAVGPVARSRLITALSDSATSVSLPCPRSGIPKARHLPCPGPTVPVADAANRCVRTYFRLYAVALHHCPSGGAAKADRWAVTHPDTPCRTVRAAGQPGRTSIKQ